MLDCQIWDDIRNGNVEKDCALLSRFLLLSFADLKTWRFYYSVAFPALVLDPPATLVNLKPASEWFSLEEVCKKTKINLYCGFPILLSV